jgi:c-di-GMP-binding flagellar brake protein YcgR
MPEADRRQHARHPLTTSVQFFHGPSRREFPARCANISAGGLMMYVPAATPVQPGQPIRVNIGDVSRPELAGLGDGPRDATIVRVNRDALFIAGHLAVGVRFGSA